MEFDDEPMLPQIGQWYVDAENQRFKVVASFEPEEWDASDFKRTAAPEDWTHALEPIEDGDAGYDEESYDASRLQLSDVVDGNVLLPGEGEVRKVRGPAHRTKSAPRKP